MTLSTRAVAVLAVLAGVVGVAAYAGAESRQPNPAGTMAPSGSSRVAVVSVKRVLQTIQERKDFEMRIQGEVKMAEDTGRQKQQKLQDLRDQQKMLKPDSSQFIDKSREITQAMYELETWRQITLRDIERTNRMQLRAQFDKIIATTERVAKQKGYDLVLADNHDNIPENLEEVSIKDVLGLIGQRTVLYVNPENDLTLDVTAALDAEYKK